MITVKCYLLLVLVAQVGSHAVAQVHDQLDRSLCHAANLVVDGVSNDSDATNERVCWIVLALVEDLILNVGDTLFT